jgi:hypothetical protein
MRERPFRPQRSEAILDQPGDTKGKWTCTAKVESYLLT